MTADAFTGTSGAGAAPTERVLSDECRAKILAERANYPEPRAAMMNSLHFAQAEVGYLPPAVVREVAGLLDVLPIQVQEVVSFYPMYRTRPVGKCHIQVARTSPAFCAAPAASCGTRRTSSASAPVR